MTIGKVNKKQRLLSSFKFMKKNTNNLTLKDFAELIEFMSETDERSTNTSQSSGTQTARPVLGVGNYGGQASRPASQVSSAGTPRPRVVIKRNDFSSFLKPEKKKQNDDDRNPLESPASRNAAE